jgi:carbonic anhydrase
VDNYCSPHDIVGTGTNEILVYKNLAHQVNYTDLNCLSVLQYAIQILSIKHVIVCGHYNCALLRPSTQFTHADLVEQWLHPVRDINQKYEPWLGWYLPESLRLEKICELNVIEQVLQLCKTTVVQNAWEQRRELTIHGWAYSPNNGILKNLALDIAGEQDIYPVYQAALRECIGKS